MPQLRQSNGPYEKISEQDEQRLLDAYENNQDFVEFAKILKKRENNCLQPCQEGTCHQFAKRWLRIEQKS